MFIISHRYVLPIQFESGMNRLINANILVGEIACVAWAIPYVLRVSDYNDNNTLWFLRIAEDRMRWIEIT